MPARAIHSEQGKILELLSTSKSRFWRSCLCLVLWIRRSHVMELPTCCRSPSCHNPVCYTRHWVGSVGNNLRPWFAIDYGMVWSEILYCLCLFDLVYQNLSFTLTTGAFVSFSFGSVFPFVPRSLSFLSFFLSLSFSFTLPFVTKIRIRHTVILHSLLD